MQTTEPTIIHLETATEICSVAVSRGKTLLALAESHDGTSHSKNLIVFVEQTLREAQLSVNQIDAVCLSAGPGSYTGLRIGAATAKGLCYSLNIPLIAVPTLESLAAAAQAAVAAPRYCPMIDARRMEVFTALYDEQLHLITDVHAQIIDNQSFTEILEEGQIVFAGNGMPKCRAILAPQKNAIFADVSLSAKNMIPLALQRFENQQFADTAYFEPFYLKEYVAAKSTVKGLYS